jgi:hypothetical protein
MSTAVAVPKRTKKQANPSPVSPETDPITDTNPLMELDCPASIESIPLSAIKLHASNRDLTNDETIAELAEGLYDGGRDGGHT